ncbi:Rha family transcriptional regulator [Glaciimonas sp. PAMC28666]|uniref:Rha family transcriptional regulator n=1 Tax=Glaciimonas sp. PAMC28666 TaxID=2807626 RepID=UPI001964EBCF|nr:Rha family transcriptional regulator [Glaciimonas sp. PAMC28666]QRX81825.1 Rha family transcriptional regulator [Glaciimonas sp. PAMC28666]
MANFPSIAAIPFVPNLTVVSGKITATSSQVAKHFHKRHDKVLSAIAFLKEDCPQDWHDLNFEETLTEVAIGQGATRKERTFQIARDGFTLLTMGFTGKKALQCKRAYIDAFNRMEAGLASPPNPLAPSHSALKSRINRHAWSLSKGMYAQFKTAMLESAIPFDATYPVEKWKPKYAQKEALIDIECVAHLMDKFSQRLREESRALASQFGED